MVEHKVYKEMISELDARIKPLTAERKQLESAERRIAEIDAELAVLQSERAEYDALLPKTDTSKFDE